MRILLLSSPSTPGGTKRIMDFLTPEHEVEFRYDYPVDLSKFDFTILHNRMDVKVDMPTGCMPCGKPSARIINDPNERNAVLGRCPKVIWANSYTAEKQLQAVLPTTRVKYMPKPFVLTIPDKVPEFPKEHRILWYWKADWTYTLPIEDEIASAIHETADMGIKIWLISNKKAQQKIIEHPNVTPMGRIDLPKEAHNFVGMVRMTEGLDYGRSTYQVLALGRWCMYVGIKEPYIVTAKDYHTLPSCVDAFARQRDWYQAQDRQTYIRNNFSEDALKRNWLMEIEEVFGK